MEVRPAGNYLEGLNPIIPKVYLSVPLVDPTKVLLWVSLLVFNMFMIVAKT